MPEWLSGYVEANALRIHYRRTGGDKPPVVLAHGFTDDGLCWTSIARALAPRYDVVMVDARGHGLTDGPETGYSLTDLAADLHGVITGLGLHRPAILGHSMGGAMTLVLAGTYPEVPGAILIEDAGQANLGMGTRHTADDREQWAQRRAWLVGLKRKTRDELIAEHRASAPRASEAEWEAWADSKLRVSFNVLARGEVPPVDWRPIISRITCPALLITADPARGAMVTPEGADELRTLIPQLQVAHIPEAGHSIRHDQFDRYREVVQEFLARTYEGAGDSPG